MALSIDRSVALGKPATSVAPTKVSYGTPENSKFSSF